MKFGMIGAGTLAQAIAGQCQGRPRTWSSQQPRPHTLGAIAGAFGPHASAGPWPRREPRTSSCSPCAGRRSATQCQLARPRGARIVIDATNQWARLTPAFVADRLETGGSELVASLIPGAHVIKAFDNMYGPYVAADPVTGAGHRILFYAGNDKDSKKLFRSVVEDFGFAPVDLGPLRMGRLMQVDGGPLTGLHAIREG